MRKGSDTAATLRSLSAVHKQLKENHAAAADLHDQAEAHVTKLLNSSADESYGSHDQIQGAPTMDRSNAFEREPAPGSHGSVKAAGLIRNEAGDLDLPEDQRKRLAKAIYSNPLDRLP